VAFLAAMQSGLSDPAAFAQGWALDRRFAPAMDEATRDARYARWGRAVAATMAV
jgi:glycerol kinase